MFSGSLFDLVHLFLDLRFSPYSSIIYKHDQLRYLNDFIIFNGPLLRFHVARCLVENAQMLSACIFERITGDFLNSNIF